MNDFEALREVMDGRYQTVIDAVNHCIAPSAETLRWQGLCYLNVQRPLDARDRLWRSIAGGCAQAKIELSTTQRQLGNMDIARTLLIEVQGLVLEPLDRVMLAREQAVHHYIAGQFREAIERLETASIEAQKTEYSGPLMSVIALSLASNLIAVGEDRRALANLTRALERPHPGKLGYLLASRAQCLINMGDLEEARKSIRQASAAKVITPLVRPILLYTEAYLERASRNLPTALWLYSEAAAVARECLESETECYALLGFTAVCTSMGLEREARRAVARARRLAVSPKATVYCDLREGALLAALDDYDALDYLERARRQLVELELVRDAAVASLHIASLQLKRARPLEVLIALRHVQQTLDSVECSGTIGVELRELPLLINHIADLSTNEYASSLCDVAVDKRKALGIRCLGSVSVTVQGKEIHLKCNKKRLAHLLAFLTICGPKTLDQIVTEVFQDVPADRARRQFHLIRNKLATAVASFEVVFDEHAQRYGLCTGNYCLRLDFVELQECLAARDLRGALDVYSGCLLPEASGDWVEGERSRLENTLVLSAIDVLHEMLDLGKNAECLELAKRLEAITMIHDEISKIVVRAAGAQGSAYASEETSRIAQRYVELVGFIPKFLQN